MLYPTHKRYGELFGIATIPLAVHFNLIPAVTLTSGSAFLAVATIYMQMRGATFGSEYPDCDSYGGPIKDAQGNPVLDEYGQPKVVKGSVPSQKHPIISKIFRALGVHHRGVYSHDMASESATWLLLLFIATMLGNQLIKLVTLGNPFISLLVNISLLGFAWVVAVDLVDLVDLIKDVASGRYRAHMQEHSWEIDVNRYQRAVIFFIGLVLLMIFSHLISWNPFNLSDALRSVGVLVTSIKVYLFATLMGVFSHLVADGMTENGVSIFGFAIKPMHYLGKIIHFKFRTGTGYEVICRWAVTLLMIPALYYAVVALGLI